MTYPSTPLESHPWITFALDTRRFDHIAWLHLGEAISKCEHLAGTALKPAMAAELHTIFLTKGVYATTSIEGNTLTEEEVRKRIEGELELAPSREYQGQEVDNIIAACNLVTSQLSRGEQIDLDVPTIDVFNLLVLDKLELEEGVVPGEIRRHNVGVAGYSGVPSGEAERLMRELCVWLNSDDFRSSDREQQAYLTILKAIIAHLYIAWIHPYGDGNGRTARLVEFLILVCGGAPTPAAHLLSNHYNLTRTQYYRELARASETRNPVPFIKYAIQGFVDGLRDQISRVRVQQFEVTWENFVHQVLSGPETEATRRRKHLVLDFPFEPLVRADLREVSPRVAREYASKGDRTLTRDLNALVRLDLLRRVQLRRDDGRTVAAYEANRRVIGAFLPLTVDAALSGA